MSSTIPPPCLSKRPDVAYDRHSRFSTRLSSFAPTAISPLSRTKEVTAPDSDEFRRLEKLEVERLRLGKSHQKGDSSRGAFLHISLFCVSFQKSCLTDILDI